MAITTFVSKIILFDNDDKFLLLTRSDTHPTLAGYYDLPGGMIERNEEPGLAVQREIKEETGLDVAFSDIKVMYAVTMHINNKSWPTLLYYGRVAGSHPDVQLSYEHKAYEWASFDKLSEVEPHLAPTYREALAYIRANNVIEDIGVSL